MGTARPSAFCLSAFLPFYLTEDWVRRLVEVYNQMMSSVRK
jgi:hypothetical protein